MFSRFQTKPRRRPRPIGPGGSRCDVDLPAPLCLFADMNSPPKALATRSRLQSCCTDRLIPTAKHPNHRYSRRMVFPGSRPLAKRRRVQVSAMPEVDRINDELGSPAQTRARSGFHSWICGRQLRHASSTSVVTRCRTRAASASCVIATRSFGAWACSISPGPNVTASIPSK